MLFAIAPQGTEQIAERPLYPYAEGDNGGYNCSAVIFDYSGGNNEPSIVDKGVYFFLRKFPFP